MYKVVIRKKVQKFILSIPEEDAVRFAEKIKLIAENPYAPLPFVKRLKNSSDFRFRFGDYRCVYSVFSDVLVIEVVSVAHRKNVYRR